MKRFLSILSLVLLGFVSQSCYDDSALWESVNDLDSRVKTLETLCKEMNTNLASLQTLVSAMKQGDYIVDVAPLTENGVEVGYQITFYDRGTVNIYHGKDGVSSGDVPDFGAKLDTDGKYYWTVNGEWILDDNGNKLPVSTAEGAAGVTPKLKVENGKWYVSYDEGKTWEEAGSAVSGDANACLFKDVQLTDDALVLTMSDGSVFTLPIGERFRIVFGEFDASTIQYGTDVVIPYTIEGAKGEVSVFVVSDGWMFETELVEETAVSGKLTIRQEDYYDEEISGKVAVFAVAEDGTTVSKVIRLLSGVLRPSSDRYDDVYTVESSASQLEFTVSTNRDFEVTTNADWITYANTKAVEEKTLVFDIQENENARRKTYVEIASGDIDFGFTVSQKGFSDGFSVNVSCDEVRGGSWIVNIDTLFNKAGQTIHEVLGYDSWEEVAAAAGDYWDAAYNRTGEVILTAYDLYTGEALPYDEQYRDGGLGFRHDSDGYLVADWSHKTSWNWINEWDGINDVLGKCFYFATNFDTNYIYAGESNSFGILFTAPEGEARIEVTVNVTEYVDPEKGLYNNPAAPGRYEFTLHNKVDIDSLTRLYSTQIATYEMAEIVKSTLGMTTYEINQIADLMDREYQLNDGSTRSGFLDLPLDVNGYVTDYGLKTTVVVPRWNFGVLPNEMNLYIDVAHSWSNGPVFGPPVYGAIGKTISYKYVIRYEGYELIFTHELEFVGETENGYALKLVNNEAQESNWQLQTWYQLDEPLKTNTTYEFKCVAKATSPYGWCGIWPQSLSTGDCNYSFGMTFNTEWTETSFTIIPDKDVYDRLVFNYGDFEGTLYIDDISLREVGSPIELIDNGHFEEGHLDGWGSWYSDSYMLSDYGEGYYGGAQIMDYTWYLVGDFNGWTPGDEAYRMTKDGDWHVYYGFTTSGAELKFNAGDWSVNRGADYFAADQAVQLWQDGMNIYVPAGTYDIYLNADASEAYFMTVNPAASPDGRCLLVKSQDMASAAWDTQFWLYFSETPMKEGDSWEVSMDVRADKEASVGTQTHVGPGGYLHWAAIGTVNFTEAWTTYTASGTVDLEMNTGDAIAFNLNDFAEANNYYFDNVSFKINGTEVITNGTFDESDDVSNFWMKEYPEINITPARIYNPE